jgi:ankyrin repeat protein
LKKVEKLILEDNWPVDQTVDANDRYSALTLACHLDFLEMVHLLDTIGADVNQGVGKFQNTPLMTATGRWNVRIVDYLIERGADPTKLDIYGFSARRKAEIKNLKTISSMLKQHESKFSSE